MEPDLIKITRKQYDPDGQESVLGLPCTTVEDLWNGKIECDGVTIEDAFNIDDIDIQDDHSTGAMSLVATIADVKMQERMMPTGFTKPRVWGYPIKEDGTIDADSDMIEDTLAEVEIANPISIEGIPVHKIYRCSGNVSYVNIQSNALMDYRVTMEGYNAENADKCVYRILSAEQAAPISLLIGEDINDDVQVNANGSFDSIYENDEHKLFALAVLADKNCNIFNIVVVHCAKGAIGDKWIHDVASKYDIPMNNLSMAYAEWPNVQYAFHANNDGKYGYLCGNGASYIITDLIARSSLDVVFELSNIERVSGENLLFGSGELSSNSWTNMHGVNWSVNNNCIIPYIYYDGVRTQKGMPTKAKFVLNQNGFFIDDVQYFSATPQPKQGTVPFALFAANWKNNIAYPSKFNAKYFIFEEDGHSVACFVPFLRNDVYGMLELITNTFYPSSSNTPFTYVLE